MIANDQARKAAERFLVSRRAGGDGAALPSGEQLSQLLVDCAHHLVTGQRMHPDAAFELAVAAWADVSGRDSRCYVDLASSSAHLVWLVDPIAQTRRAIPVVDLVRMLGPRAVSTAVA